MFASSAYFTAGEDKKQKANLDHLFLAESGAKIKTTSKEISWNIFCCISSDNIF